MYGLITPNVQTICNPFLLFLSICIKKKTLNKKTLFKKMWPCVTATDVVIRAAFLSFGEQLLLVLDTVCFLIWYKK